MQCRTGDLLHKTGRFLPWHRGFTLAHETLLRDECGYTGNIPYWNWTYVTYMFIFHVCTFTHCEESLTFRSDAGHFSTAKILTPEHFGSNGIGPNHAVVDGPFGSEYTHHLVVVVVRPDLMLRVRRLDPSSRARRREHRTHAHEDRRRNQLNLRPSKVSFTFHFHLERPHPSPLTPLPFEGTSTNARQRPPTAPSCAAPTPILERSPYTAEVCTAACISVLEAI